MLLVFIYLLLYIRAFLDKDDRFAVYPYRDSLYHRVGRDRSLVLFQSHIYIIFMLFLHEHRLPIDSLVYANLTFLVQSVQLLPDFLVHLVHEAGKLHVVGDYVLLPFLLLETGDDG